MSSRTYTLEIVTQERVVYAGEVTSVMAPGDRGYFSVWANHAPFLAALRSGVMTIREAGGSEVRLAVGGGFFEVNSNHVIVLADSADFPDEIYAGMERDRLKDARDRMLHPLAASSDLETARRQAELSEAKLKVVGNR
ncbi:MAG: ATP synthase F1 subunit epsilon [Armatimonadetes bacterium]|nr:ATP synthase F1 subunit epsilon [Armatimonadota bacterium]PIU64132.1 MAG: ATP synthase F1 subunit epsilon [Armatimonadetes bacterium CG07_land_8_20_14_0_80_59_28]PIY44286.1 MAG: ATP synthase F1 subunit epsilon [Armatimonadetes bacterium CG_4_10_14_3_um_filter_59_10]PJB63872.1 MAG: ATP synthase F1 subunit epsilon [Armatimonadetes bacterium CG_4_9_14_3_um_filter_58_7]